ncbi:glycosyl transferase family 1 [Mesorhizobium sp. YIM 152430]|uniref:glycosyl transferase family 1 n=1 Tax=Mesorhizobium sp. YIM 152430 TaxID=3031761 RepID=UPI0023D9C1A6|nr:glycosyl transferase family 1 [Mesorhizobium sp. YIM 152430]MDF1600805.1 glycosyl transferase family 1 [Mesorhizobium sp. YIM 152430]
MLHVLYLVHDLTDPAVGRRVAMLEAGGARVAVAGFRRDDRAAPARLGRSTPIDLGITRDGKFFQRIAAVTAAALALRARLDGVDQPDIIIARHLEMLVLADRAKGLFPLRPAIVYESLDIHRLLLAGNAVGRTMRAAERRFARSAQLLLTSSPAFLRGYFEPYGQLDAPVLLLENKVLDLDNPSPAKAQRLPVPTKGEPWKIGWFGALRCARSLDVLIDLARHLAGRVELVLRGRPAYDAIPDFDARVEAAPHVAFHGPYRNPDDLGAIYGEVHFNWAIDFFEEGLNSEWLLPNRLYEGGRHGTIPIARAGTETARFLTDRAMGIVLDTCSADELASVVSNLDAARFADLHARLDAIDPATWTATRSDCEALVSRLSSLGPQPELRAAA